AMEEPNLRGARGRAKRAAEWGPSALPAGDGTGSPRELGRGQADVDPGPPTGTAVDGQRAAEELQQPGDDRQPEARPAVGAPHEGIERVRGDVGRDARAGVQHGDADRVAL